MYTLEVIQILYAHFDREKKSFAAPTKFLLKLNQHKSIVDLTNVFVVSRGAEMSVI